MMNFFLHLIFNFDLILINTFNFFYFFFYVYSAILLWNIGRKKPIFTRFRAHATPANSTTNQNSMTSPPPCEGITALASVKYSDLFASGSASGSIHLWKIGDAKKNFTLLTSIPMVRYL